MKTELIEFLEVKKQYIKDGYELFYLFETAYIPEGQDLYIKKLNGLIKKCDDEHVDNEKSIINYLKFAYLQKIYTKYEPMINLLHIGCKSGFIDGEIAFLDEVGNENENFDIQMKKKWITAQMEKILKQLPDKSVIIMTQEKHYLIKAKTSRCLNESMSQNICKSKKMTTRERQAQMKGQKKITSFFPSIKSSSVSTSQKKSFIERPTIPDPGYKFELMARVLRGDTVKVNYQSIN